MTTIKQRLRDEARVALDDLLPEGSTVYTVLRHVSKSGMSREIDLYTVRDGEIVYLSGYAANLCGWTRSAGAHSAIKVRGTGMDMGFTLVYDLSLTLNAPDNQGGYKLYHRWL